MDKPEQYAWATVVFGGFDVNRPEQCIIMKVMVDAKDPPSEATAKKHVDDVLGYWAEAPEGNKRPEWLVGVNTLVTKPGASCFSPDAIAYGWKMEGADFVKFWSTGDRVPTVFNQQRVQVVMSLGKDYGPELLEASKACRAGLNLASRLEDGHMDTQMLLAAVWDRAAAAGVHEFSIIGAFVNAIMSKAKATDLRAQRDLARMMAQRCDALASEKDDLMQRLSHKPVMGRPQ